MLMLDLAAGTQPFGKGTWHAPSQDSKRHAKQKHSKTWTSNTSEGPS